LPTPFGLVLAEVSVEELEAAGALAVASVLAAPLSEPELQAAIQPIAPSASVERNSFDFIKQAIYGYRINVKYETFQ
jgi:hypothetical protein